MNESFRYEVQQRLADHPELIALFGSTLCIPERLYEYDPNIFVVYNGKNEQFEIHSLANKANTLCAVLPYKSLDSRAIRYVWKNDIRVHGAAIFERIERGEQLKEKKQDRDFKNWIEDVAKETRSLIAKDAWTLGT